MKSLIVFILLLSSGLALAQDCDENTLPSTIEKEIAFATFQDMLQYTLKIPANSVITRSGIDYNKKCEILFDRTQEDSKSIMLTLKTSDKKEIKFEITPDVLTSNDPKRRLPDFLYISSSQGDDYLKTLEMRKTLDKSSIYFMIYDHEARRIGTDALHTCTIKL